jgi:murein DD-endopeptidase MepM/ murein hydrolase activator NlpD
VLVTLLWGGPERAADPPDLDTEALVETEVVEPGPGSDVQEPEALDPELEPTPQDIDPNLEVITAHVVHSLARTFQSASPERGDAIAAVYARLFAWDLDLRRDLQAGDAVGIVYDPRGEHPEVHAATYRSQKRGELFRAYRFQAAGDVYPSWWDAEGREVPRRLVGGPIEHYAQVTALLKDRPSHKGMDFKANEGTPVVAALAGTVMRVNWNVANNGYCVELRYDDGVVARMLHLSEVDVKAGQSVRQGVQVGKVGNTGRSTAAHLHYELERAGRIIDPVDYHGVRRRDLTDDDRALLQRGQGAMDAMLSVLDAG